jgi:hypothetical protein
MWAFCCRRQKRMCHFRNNLKNGRRSAFTLVEVAVTILVVALIVGSAMTILDRLVGAMADMHLRGEAFEIARQKMEGLLSETNISDKSEYGTSDLYPEIQWQTVVEPFYEPINNTMWIRAVCSAGFNDSKGQYQSIDLEHWITNLSAELIRQIVQQQKTEQEYLDLLSDTEASAIEETTIAYLAQAGLDVDKYTDFLLQQRRKKLDYIAKNGFGGGYEALLEELQQEEDRFLLGLGMDFAAYNNFAKTYVPQSSESPAADISDEPVPADREPTTDSDQPASADKPSDSSREKSPTTAEKPVTADELRARGFPESLIPLLVQLLNS